jgi:DMSO/TMAO reductase YedYZ heme-binding membrane subunit
MTGPRLPLIALLLTTALCGAVYAALGTGEGSVRLSVRLTARIAAVLFALTFSASALLRFFPSATTRWIGAQRRYLGLAFAAVHFAHLATLGLLAAGHPDPFVADTSATTLIGGGLAYLFVALMAITSNDRAMRALGKAWPRLHKIGGWYVWLIFFQSYLGRVTGGDATYAPLLLMMLLVLALRVTHARKLRDA